MWLHTKCAPRMIVQIWVLVMYTLQGEILTVSCKESILASIEIKNKPERQFSSEEIGHRFNYSHWSVHTIYHAKLSAF